MEYKKIDYNKYTKEQLIELLEISDDGAFHLRNECDALYYRLEKIKDALIEANKKNDKAIEYIETNKEEYGGDIYIVCKELEDILKGEE